MAVTAAEVQAKFTSVGADQVKRDLAGVGNAVQSADKKGQGFLGTMTKVAGGFILGNVIIKGTGALLGFGKSLVSSSSDMEGFRIQLEVATGSVEKANAVFDRTRKMAAETPFEFPELVEGAANLEALGMASEKWMPVIADTAAGTNKSIDQTVQAVLDASSGEFERLKEFGIRTKVEGDKVKFSFMQNGKEMVIEAQNTQEGISSALMGIWDQKYDGAMEKFATSFQGRFSTLVDNIRMRAQDMFQPVFEQLSAGIGRVNEFFDQVDTEGWGAAFKDLAIDLGAVAVNVGEWIVGVIPDVMDWLATTALPAIGRGAVWLGNVLITGVQWVWDEGIPNLWDWLKTKVAGWLGIGEAQADGDLIDTLTVTIGEFDLPDIGEKLRTSVSSKVDEWVGETKNDPIDAGTVTVKVTPDVTFGDILRAIDRKFREETRVTPEMEAGFRESGQGVGRSMGGRFMDGVRSAVDAIFGGGGEGAGGAGGAAGGATGNAGLYRVVRSWTSGFLQGFGTGVMEELNAWGPGFRQDVRDWWNGFAPSLFEFDRVSPIQAGGTVGAGGALLKALGIEDQTFGESIISDLQGKWDGFKQRVQGIFDDVPEISIPTISIDWPFDSIAEGWQDALDLFTSIIEWVKNPWQNVGAIEISLPSISVDWGPVDDIIETVGEKTKSLKDAWDDLTGVFSGGGADDGMIGAAGGITGKMTETLRQRAIALGAALGTSLSPSGGFGGPRTKVLQEWGDFGADAASRFASAVQSGLAAVGGTSVTMTVEADTGAALTAMRAAGTALAGLDGEDATTYVLGDNAAALTAVDDAAAAIGNIVGLSAMTFVNGDNRNALDAIGEAADRMTEFDGTVATGYLQAINNVGSAVAAAAKALNSFDGRSATAYVNVVSRGASALAGRIPGFADGGTVRSPLAIVGERGPELVSLPYGARVYSSSESAAMLARAGAGAPPVSLTIHQHIAGSVIAENDLIDKTIDGIAAVVPIASARIRRSQGVV